MKLFLLHPFAPSFSCLNKMAVGAGAEDDRLRQIVREEIQVAPGQNAAWAPCRMSSERYAKGVPVQQRRTHLRGPGGCSPGKIFKNKVARIALVTISASRYNRKII